MKFSLFAIVVVGACISSSLLVSAAPVEASIHPPVFYRDPQPRDADIRKRDNIRGSSDTSDDRSVTTSHYHLNGGGNLVRRTVSPPRPDTPYSVDITDVWKNQQIQPKADTSKHETAVSRFTPIRTPSVASSVDITDQIPAKRKGKQRAKTNPRRKAKSAPRSGSPAPAEEDEAELGWFQKALLNVLVRSASSYSMIGGQYANVHQDT